MIFPIYCPLRYRLHYPRSIVAIQTQSICSQGLQFSADTSDAKFPIDINADWTAFKVELLEL